MIFSKIHIGEISYLFCLAKILFYLVSSLPIAVNKEPSLVENNKHFINCIYNRLKHYTHLNIHV